MKDPVRNEQVTERFHAYNPAKCTLWWDIDSRCARGLAACIHPRLVEANHRSGFSPNDLRVVKLLSPKFMGFRVCRAAGKGEEA